MNNKGFAVSTVLYTLLIAFLMFLGAALAQFSSSSSLIGKANDDLINGTSLNATLVKGDNTRLIKVNSRYGTFYWPADFNPGINSSTQMNIGDNAGENDKIMVSVSSAFDPEAHIYELTFTDKSTNDSSSAYSDWSINK